MGSPLQAAASALPATEARVALDDVNGWGRQVLRRDLTRFERTTARVWLVQQAKAARRQLPVLAAKRPATTPNSECGRCRQLVPMQWTGTGWSEPTCDGEACGWSVTQIALPPPPSPMDMGDAIGLLRREAWAFRWVDKPLLARNTVLVGGFERWRLALQIIANDGDPESARLAADALLLNESDLPALLPAPLPRWLGDLDRFEETDFEEADWERRLALDAEAEDADWSPLPPRTAQGF